MATLGENRGVGPLSEDVDGRGQGKMRPASPWRYAGRSWLNGKLRQLLDRMRDGNDNVENGIFPANLQKEM